MAEDGSNSLVGRRPVRVQDERLLGVELWVGEDGGLAQCLAELGERPLHGGRRGKGGRVRRPVLLRSVCQGGGDGGIIFDEAPVVAHFAQEGPYITARSRDRPFADDVSVLWDGGDAGRRDPVAQVVDLGFEQLAFGRFQSEARLLVRHQYSFKVGEVLFDSSRVDDDSSRYGSAMLAGMPWRTMRMRRAYVAGPLHSPKGSRLNWYCPNGVEKAVFSLAPLASGIWLNAPAPFRAEKIVERERRDRLSSTFPMACESLVVTSLSRR